MTDQEREDPPVGVRKNRIENIRKWWEWSNDGGLMSGMQFDATLDKDRHMLYRRNRLYTAHSEMIADIQRLRTGGDRWDLRRDSYWGHRVVREPHRYARPIVRLEIPNPLTWNRYETVRRTLADMGVDAYVATLGVLEQSSILAATVELVDQERRSRPGRIAEHVLKAQVFVHPRQLRDAYFLSGYDNQEKGLRYFFCELPPGVEPKSLEEAYEALQPRSVRLAIQQGVPVRRQGDMFFIRQHGYEPPNLDRVVPQARLFRSNHFVDEHYVDVRQGRPVIYVRGTVKHAPFGRRPDHKNLRLGATWWIAVQNTVPMSEWMS